MSHPRSSSLHRYALGEADGEERLIIDRHVATCARCRALLAGEHRLDELLLQGGGAPSDEVLDRLAFEGLWARVDAAPVVARAPRRVIRTSAAAFVLVGLCALAWSWLRTGHDSPAVAAPASVPVPAPRDDVAPPEVAVDVVAPLAAADVARLQGVREELRAVIARGQREAPASLPELQAACAAPLAAFRAAEWPVDRLVAGLVGDAQADTARGALRLAAGTREGQAAVSACLRDGSRVVEALLALEAVELRPAANATLAGALLGLVQPADGGGPGEHDLRAARLLAQDAGPESRAALGRALDRALAAMAESPSTSGTREAAMRARLLLLGDVAPADLVASRACAAAAGAAARDGTGELLLRAAARDRAGCALGLQRGLEGAGIEVCRRIAAFAVRLDLDVAAPALLQALAAHPDEELLQQAVASLAGAREAPALVDLLAVSQGRTRGAVRDVLHEVLVREPASLEPAGRALGAQAVDEAVRLAQALGPAVEGQPGGSDLLLEALSARPPGRPDEEGTSELLAALAALTEPAAGSALLAWIAGRPAGDPCLPLAWTAAAHLAPDSAISTWARDVGDPRPLARLVEGQAWQKAARFPPRRVLQPLREALRDRDHDDDPHPAGASGQPEPR